MLVPISWIKDYVDIENIDIDTYRDEMILSGSNVEEVKKIGDTIDKIVVGKIEQLLPHPDAEKLQIVMLNIGEDTIQLVTAAKNIAEGDFVPAVLSGGLIADGTKIKKGKLRGVESNGMLCSLAELGFNDSVIPTDVKDGIFIINQECNPGDDIDTALKFSESVIEYEITPNRPDCLSMIGMARESAAVYEKEVKYPKLEVKNTVDDINDYINIQINNEELCTRFVARAIKDVTIGPSPWWMQKRLMTAGVRPISNIVDITNYVMLEYGQPLHAYDLEDIAKNTIIVDNASEGQKFTTLDDSERKLTKEMLMINDGEKPVGLAGIMGGLNSEIKDHTKTILIEGANFDADNIRATSKKIGLRTEASSRFEKGIDSNLCKDAVNRVCELVELLECGTVVSGTVDIYPKVRTSIETKVRTSRVNSILGTSMTPDALKRIFERLEMVVNADGDDLYVTPPTARLDLKEEVDYIEEAVRIYGYDVLDTTVPKGSTQGGKSQRQQMMDGAKDTLTALGINEIQTYSFVSPKTVEMINVSKDSIKRNFVKLLNPLGEENSVMRTSLLPNVLEVIVRNNNRNIEEVTAFELGRIFIKGDELLPREIHNIAIGMYGKNNDFYAIKGDVEALLGKMGIKEYTFLPEKNNSTFHPGRCASIIADGHVLGTLGEIHPDVAENYDIDQRVYVAELDFELLLECGDTEKLYAPLPKYPAMTRDIALVVKEEVYANQIEKIIIDKGGKLLEDVKLFDIYRGKQVEEGYKSMAYSLTYRNMEKTLTEEEVTAVHSKVLKALDSELEASLRE